MHAVPRFLFRYSRFAILPMLFSLLLGCGYKGPLFLPVPPDTLTGQGTVIQEPDTQPNNPPQNPSLEPTPIVIE